MLIYLSLGATFRESMLVSLMDMDVGADLIFGWDWISSQDLHPLYADGIVSSPGSLSGRLLYMISYMIS